MIGPLRLFCALCLLVLPLTSGFAVSSIRHSIILQNISQALAKGPDGNIWYAGIESDGVEGIGHIFADGHIESFAIDSVLMINSGPDGNIWFAAKHGDNFATGTITSQGQVSEKTLTGVANLVWIASGPGHRLWLSYYDSLGNPKVGSVDDLGVVSGYAVPAAPTMITKGSDGNLWFPLHGSVMRMTVGGDLTTFSLPMGARSNAPMVPNWIIDGPNGDLWITSNDIVVLGGPPYYASPSIAEMSVDGVATILTMPDYGEIPYGDDGEAPGEIAFASDATAWTLLRVVGAPACTLVRRAINANFVPLRIHTPDCSQIVSDARGTLWIADGWEGELIEVNVPLDLIFSDGVDEL